MLSLMSVLSSQQIDGSSAEANKDGHDENVASSATSSESDGSAKDGEAGHYYVKTYTWTPDFGRQEVVLDACRSADAGGYLHYGI